MYVYVLQISSYIKHDFWQYHKTVFLHSIVANEKFYFVVDEKYIILFYFFNFKNVLFPLSTAFNKIESCDRLLSLQQYE